MNKKYIYVLLIMFLLSSFSCTPEFRHKLLTLFFDGVPGREFTNSDTIISSLQADTVSLVVDTKKGSVHVPYRDKQCIKCHSDKDIGALQKPQPELCYQCHDDFKLKYDKVHGPVEAGYCTDCHQPHKTETEDLLLRESQALCVGCHDSEQVFESIFHQEIGEQNCVECHDPHGGENRFMLKANSCYQCHENFADLYTSLHGPVAAGSCTICHGTHDTKAEFLLVRTGPELCLDCHKASDVFDNPTHTNIGDRNCTDCHSPHGGKNKFLPRTKDCFNCHDDFGQTYNFVHGPASADLYCSYCHNTRKTEAEYLLLRMGQDMCLFCHELKAVLENQEHKDMGENDCTQCHNPHGSEDPNILNQGR